MIGSILLLVTAVILPMSEPEKVVPMPVDLEASAEWPAPGMIIPSAVAFTPSGDALTYLAPAGAGTSQVLWKAGLTGDDPQVIARPPGDGNTEANLSLEEQLRRERQRQRETGITQVVRAGNSEVVVFPLQGDLFLLRPGQPDLVALTKGGRGGVDPQLNPSGQRVAFVRDRDLVVLDLDNQKEQALTKDAPEGVSRGLAEFIAQEELGRQSGFWWSPDGARIAYQETEERHIPQFSITHQGGDDFSIETHRYPFAGQPNARVRLGVIDAKGGPTTWLKLADDDDQFYLARVTWDSPTSFVVQTLNRAQTRLSVARFDAATGERALLWEERGDPWINLHNDLKVLGELGYLWSSERSGFRHLELRDRAGKLTRVLTSGEWIVDELLSVDLTRREAWFRGWRESPVESHVFRVSLDGGEPTRITQQPGVYNAVVSPTGDFLAVTSSTLETPPKMALLDLSGRLVKLLTDGASDSRVGQRRLVPPRLTSFRNREGVTLHGAYYAPRGVSPGERVPLVVMVYGGPHVQRVTQSWDLTADLTAQLFAEQGYAVWKLDNRGAARRGVAFEAAVNRRMGTVEVDDQVDGVAFAKASWPEIDLHRVGITGGSYGGYMTLRAMILAPSVFRSGVAIAPVTDWDGYDTAYTERYMGTPAADPDAYRDSSVLEHVSKLQGDLLLVHGLLDENVHFRHTARLVDALINANRSFDLLPIPKGRHSSRRIKDRYYLNSRMLQFFDRTLKAKPR